ncbi:hypothetical protein JCM11251_002499 [Rhodosporidiobolus azoricus]
MSLSIPQSLHDITHAHPLPLSPPPKRFTSTLPTYYVLYRYGWEDFSAARAEPPQDWRHVAASLHKALERCVGAEHGSANLYRMKLLAVEEQRLLLFVCFLMEHEKDVGSMIRLVEAQQKVDKEQFDSWEHHSDSTQCQTAIEARHIAITHRGEELIRLQSWLQELSWKRLSRKEVDEWLAAQYQLLEPTDLKHSPYRAKWGE